MTGRHFKNIWLLFIFSICILALWLPLSFVLLNYLNSKSDVTETGHSLLFGDFSSSHLPFALEHSPEDDFVSDIFRFPPATRPRPNSSVWWTQVYGQPEFSSFEPLISVITTSYHSDLGYLQQTALCVLQQTFPLWEWIDNC
jgi:hypothetical protein